MSDATPPIDPEQTTGEEEYANRSLRDRVRDNPRPAAIWLAGVALLVALEFGRIVAGIMVFGEAIVFVIEGFAGLPPYIGGNVGGLASGSVGAVLGGLGHHATLLAMLFVVSLFLQGPFPFDLEDMLGRELSRRRRIYGERLAITAVLGAIAFTLIYTPVGTILDEEFAVWYGVVELVSEVPTLTSRELISNTGHQTPGGGWSGTFLGLSPAWAWTIRFVLVWIYAAVAFAWAWRGYNVYREHYREADWTPRDDTIKRFKSQYWGLFGLFVVFGFVVLAVFAPALSPSTAQEDIYQPYDENSRVEYLNEDGEVEEVYQGRANLLSESDGQSTVGPLSYDNFGRWRPLGTTPDGGSMLTNLAYGARTSLIIALSAVGFGSLIAIVLSLLSAYYRGILDMVVVFTSDTIISIPVLVLVMMLVVIFQQSNHWLAQPLDGGLLLAIILGFAYWPGMWRSIRGPSLQVSEQEWVDAAKTYGQTPRKIMRKHMAPYVMSYIMIYSSLLLGGIIITVSALSFLGLGINEPTPEWGRLISSGRGYISTSSWHVSTISGIMIALVVLGFNALGDGIRDAIDPEADVGEGDDAGTAAGGGGG
jgi:peptide/nickel transport system permease protein